jgi:hypothetical protein
VVTTAGHFVVLFVACYISFSVFFYVYACKGKGCTPTHHGRSKRFGFYDRTSVWTASNGDMLLGTYSGQLVFNPAGGYFETHGYFYLNGGTGRFQHATEEGPASGIQYLDDTTDLIPDGTISYFR